MGFDNIQLRVLRELDGCILSLLSLIFEKFMEIRGHQRRLQKKAKLTRIYKKV